MKKWSVLCALFKSISVYQQTRSWFYRININELMKNLMLGTKHVRNLKIIWMIPRMLLIYIAKSLDGLIVVLFITKTHHSIVIFFWQTGNRLFAGLAAAFPQDWKVLSKVRWNRHFRVLITRADFYTARLKTKELYATSLTNNFYEF